VAALQKHSDDYWFAYIGVNILKTSPELLSFNLSALPDCLRSVL
jgi:hypothetical protein